MEFGFQFSNLEPARVRDLARVAEGEGYDVIVFPDHIVIEGPERQYDPHTLAYDVVSLATVVADSTTSPNWAPVAMQFVSSSRDNGAKSRHS
jgi:alkanesulfonate monooxygenase SsuD/methylene tetrahydromethanopterin reductase-like flavin-dependent oxidoreductase (luciferase family)